MEPYRQFSDLSVDNPKGLETLDSPHNWSNNPGFIKKDKPMLGSHAKDEPMLGSHSKDEPMLGSHPEDEPMLGGTGSTEATYKAERKSTPDNDYYDRQAGDEFMTHVKAWAKGK